MGMTRQTKEEMVESLSERLSRAKAALVASYTGLNVQAVSEVRRVFREAEAEYKVIKNTLMKRALQGTGHEGLIKHVDGPTAVVFKYDEEFGRLGKAAKELNKKYEKFQVRAAFLEEDIIEENAVEKLAELPTLDEARAQLLGVINAPAANLLAQINAPAQHLIGVIKAKQEKDEEAAA